MEKNKRKTFLFATIIFALGVLFVLLSFHFVEYSIKHWDPETGMYLYSSHFTVFPKDNLTFSNTFVNIDDINNLIIRYNNAGVREKIIITTEPLTRKLIEKGIW